MNIENMLRQYNDWIIMSGLAIAIGYIFGFLPQTTEILDMGTNVKFIYTAIIILSGFTYHKFFWGKLQKSPVYQKVVAPRILKMSHSQQLQSRPQYDKPTAMQSQPAKPAPQTPPQHIFDKFKNS